MLSRRLYNTVSSRRAAHSLSIRSSPWTQPCKPQSSGKGRVKPLRGSSVGARLSAAKVSRTNEDGRKGPSPSSVVKEKNGGRRRRPSVVLRRQDARGNEYEAMKHQRLGEPIHTSSIQSALHVGLTPPHLPLPIPLGIDMYFCAPAAQHRRIPLPSEWIESTLGPFDATLRPLKIRNPPGQALSEQTTPETGRSGLADHLHVMTVLSQPGRTHHLRFDERPHASAQSAPFFDEDPTPSFHRDINAARHRNALATERERSSVLALIETALTSKSSRPRATRVVVRQSQKAGVDTAVSALDGLLQKLASGRRKSESVRMVAVVGEDGGEEWIRMDSTQRKRKKKINKHKYKKRRKATRALRKRLGK